MSLLNAQGEAAKVTVWSHVGGLAWIFTLTWTIENLPETGYLLVYGVTDASGVRVNGEDLPKVTTTGFGSMPIGWKADLAGNRLIIRLPSRQVEQSAPTTRIEVGWSLSRE